MEDKIMELVKENVTVNQVLCKGSVTATVDEDIIVPDVKADIVKVLQMDSTACVTGKSVQDGRANVSGRCDLKILYVPDSESEQIKSIVTSFDFTRDISDGCILSGMKPVISANVERAEYTLINSRKLRVKVSICLDYEIVEESDIELAVDAADSNRAEIRKESISIQNCVGICEDEFSLSDNIVIPQGQCAANEILKADTKISDTEYKTVTGKIMVKGTAGVSVLYTDEENKIRFMEAEIPFTEVMDCEGATDETVCDMEFAVMDTTARLTEDSDGERRVISLDITLCATVKATENIETEIISDCYEPFMKTELIKEEKELDEVVARPMTQTTLREVIEPDRDAPAVAGVYGCFTRPYVNKAELKGGSLFAEGKIETYVLYLTDSRDMPACSVKKDIPFSVTMNTGIDTEEENLVPEIKAEVQHMAYNLNMAGEIELRCVVNVSANIVKKRKIELIEEVVTEESEGARRGIVIYFVQKGDSLWEISKRYAVPRSEILKFNNMEEEDLLKTGERLFIPNI